MNIPEIRKMINGEDVPDMVDLVETVEGLCDEVEALRKQIEEMEYSAWEEAMGEDL